jgi:hypothetical protein
MGGKKTEEFLTYLGVEKNWLWRKRLPLLLKLLKIRL